MATFRRKAANRTVSELAERCFCSERHVRTLFVRHRRRDGWSGRRSQDAESGTITLSGHARIATQCDDGKGLETGKQQDVLELAQLAPGELALCYSRLWADNGKTIHPRCDSLLSPARTATTGLFARPCRQHLAGQIFSGLTRFDNNTQRRLAI